MEKICFMYKTTCHVKDKNVENKARSTLKKEKYTNFIRAYFFLPENSYRMSCYSVLCAKLNVISQLFIYFAQTFNPILFFILALDRLYELVASLVLPNNFFVLSFQVRMRNMDKVITTTHLKTKKYKDTCFLYFSFVLWILYLHLTLLFGWFGQWWRDLVCFIGKIAIVKRNYVHTVYFHQPLKNFPRSSLVEVAFYPSHLIKMTHQTA